MNSEPGHTDQEFRQAYRKAADYCAVQEHCISEIRMKMRAWSIPDHWHQDIIAQLVNEGFINEQRYAESYAGAKFRFNEWGKIKITAELRAQSIPDAIIQTALQSIDNEEYITCLKKLLSQKMRLTGSRSVADRQKAARFAASKGFEPSLIFNLLKNNLLTE